MNNNLAPTHKKLFGDYWVLWYAISNSYSIIEPEFNRLLEVYLESKLKADFTNKVSSDLEVSESNSLFETFFNYLKTCNIPYVPTSTPSIELEITYRAISKTYTIEGKTIQIYYSSEIVMQTIHPALAHYITDDRRDDVLATFDLYIDQNNLHLYKDAQLLCYVPKRDYHHIQGKFIMHLLCTLHNNNESDWIGTLHGSTITDGNSSILFVGESGKGKSTLCALLAANGFNLLADDVSPLLSNDKYIYYNPSAISLKKGAFKLLQPLTSNFNNIPVVNFNKTKGDIKYIPCAKPVQNAYPCSAIILVNYRPNSQTKLEPVSVKTILETLIPDSWLSPNKKHAQQFLDWLAELKLYQLTYSDTESVKDEVSKVFKQYDQKF